MLLVPQRQLLSVIVATTAVSICFRAVAFGLRASAFFQYANTMAAFDALGLGALLSYYESTADERGRARLVGLGRIGLRLSLACWGMNAAVPGNPLVVGVYDPCLAWGVFDCAGGAGERGCLGEGARVGRLLLEVALTILVPGLSYVWVEGAIGRLKRYFGYEVARVRTPPKWAAV